MDPHASARTAPRAQGALAVGCASLVCVLFGSLGWLVCAPGDRPDAAYFQLVRDHTRELDRMDALLRIAPELARISASGLRVDSGCYPGQRDPASLGVMGPSCAHVPAPSSMGGTIAPPVTFEPTGWTNAQAAAVAQTTESNVVEWRSLLAVSGVVRVWPHLSATHGLYQLGDELRGVSRSPGSGGCTFSTENLGGELRCIASGESWSARAIPGSGYVLHHFVE